MTAQHIDLRIIPTPFGDDWRDSLDGRDLHAGDVIELWDGSWVTVRYETAGWTVAVVWINSEHALTVERDRMRFRWPNK